MFSNVFDKWEMFGGGAMEMSLVLFYRFHSTDGEDIDEREKNRAEKVP